MIKPSPFRNPAQELKGDFAVHPYDQYTRDNLILGPKNSLAVIYPWLNDKLKYCPKDGEYFDASAEECPKCGTLNIEDRTLADKIVEKKILPLWKSRKYGLDPYELYYIFLDFDIMRVGTRLPNGELEDITFDIKTCLMSQNVLLLKLLELECMSMEMEKYIDQMLGMKVDAESIEDIVKKDFPDIYGKKEEKSESKEFVKELRKSLAIYTDVLNKLKMPNTGKFRFFKPGNYEKDFKERISKNYSTVAGATFSGVVEFLKSKMGVN